MTDFPRFDDVQDTNLRNWNRVNMLFNIKQLVDNSVGTKYVEQFEKYDKIAIYIMCNAIIINGYENTRRSLFKEQNA